VDKTALAEANIELGRRFVQALLKAPSVRLEAAFWWLDESRWRFIVATPVVHERGRIAAITEIEHALGDRLNQFKPILDRLRVLTPSEGIITVLDIGSSGRIPLDRVVEEESVNGAYVKGAYFYHFAPKTYMVA
jgi:hypothetical protein